MAYPRDISVGEDFDIEVASDKDLLLTRGSQNVEQHATLDASQETRKILGGPINGTSIARLEQSVQNILEQRAYVEEVFSVEVTEIDKEEEQVNLDVKFTDDEGFQVTSVGLAAPSIGGGISTGQLCIQDGETRTYESPLVVTNVFCVNSGGTAYIPQDEDRCVESGTSERVSGTLTVDQTQCIGGSMIIDV